METKPDGFYEFPDVENGNYLVTPKKTDYTFSPEQQLVTISDNTVSGVDFTSNYLIRFVNNDDGTVTDMSTNLIWLKNANCFGSRNWATALNWTAEINSGDCGLTDGSLAGDWRLPYKVELQGIGTEPPTNWPIGSPSVPWTIPSAPFTNVKTTFHWSKSESLVNNNNAWYIRMLDGYSLSGDKAGAVGVWPVRSSRFTDNGDGTVTDTSTDLIWLKNADCFGKQHWWSATASAAGLNSGECGLTDGTLAGDWRLPTIHELQGIGTDPQTNTYKGLPSADWTIPTEPFTGEDPSYLYWSNSVSVATDAWFLRLLDGYTVNGKKKASIYVWPVRR
jgi:hypothetical protein